MIRSKRVMISVLTLVLTVIALGATTFAWFSLSTVSNVSNISGEVRGGEGLEIRLVGVDKDDKEVATSWKSNLSEDDVEEFLLALVTSEFEFNAVSTNNGTSFTKMTTTDKKTVVNGLDADPNEDYLEFKIQFKSPTDGDVKLDGFEFKNGKLGEVFEPEVAYDQFAVGAEGTEEILVDPSNGARFSLEVTQGANGSGILAYQKPGKGYAKVDGQDYYDGNSDSNDFVTFGQYSYLTTSKQMELYYKNENNEIVEFESSHADFIGAQTDVTNGTKFELVPNTFGWDDTKTDDHVAELTIRVWLEGWDADTYDSLYKGILEVYLTFVKDVEID